MGQGAVAKVPPPHPTPTLQTHPKAMKDPLPCTVASLDTSYSGGKKKGAALTQIPTPNKRTQHGNIRSHIQLCIPAVYHLQQKQKAPRFTSYVVVFTLEKCDRWGKQRNLSKVHTNNSVTLNIISFLKGWKWYTWAYWYFSFIRWHILSMRKKMSNISSDSLPASNL